MNNASMRLYDYISIIQETRAAMHLRYILVQCIYSLKARTTIQYNQYCRQTGMILNDRNDGRQVFLCITHQYVFSYDFCD